VRTPALFEGKIDFFLGSKGATLHVVEVLGKRHGKEVGYLSFKDMGLKTYGHVLQAHEGADLDFLAGKSGSFVPRDNH